MIEEKFNFKGLRTVEYCRKSTERSDRQVASLQDQHISNNRTIKEFGLRRKPDDLYMESKSAKKIGRPLFNEMIRRIQNKEFDVIVTYQPDRLSRNSRDAGELIALLDEGYIKAIITHNQVHTVSDKLMLGILFGMSEQFRDELSAKVKRGMHSRAETGILPGNPKAGYKNVKDEDDRTIQAKDTPRFEMLQRALKLYLTGNYTVPELLTMLNKDWGFRTRKTKKLGNKPLSKSTLYSILRDPYYYGKQRWGSIEADLHKDIPRMITEDEYWEIQRILGNKGVKRPYKQKNIHLPFRGLIKCGECGKTFIPYLQRKKLANGELKYYEYIRCNRNILKDPCTQIQVRIDDIENQVEKILEEIEVPQDFVDWAIKWIKEQNQDKANEHQNRLNSFTKQLNNNRTKIKKIIEGYTENLFTKTEVEEFKREIEAENKIILRNIDNLNEHDYKWIDKAIETFEFALNARENFKKGDYAKKTEILNSLGQNILIKEKQIIIKLNKPLSVIKNNKDKLTDNSRNIKPDESAVNIAINGESEVKNLAWSGWPDLNRRPHAPHAYTLANCATPRYLQGL